MSKFYDREMSKELNSIVIRIDKMSEKDLDKLLNIKNHIPKSAWKRPEASGAQLVERFRKNTGIVKL